MCKPGARGKIRWVVQAAGGTAGQASKAELKEWLERIQVSCVNRL